MNRFLGPLARSCAARPWRALLLWVVGAATAFGLAAAFGAPAQEDWDAPGTPAQRGIDLLRAHLPEAGNASAQVVVHDRRGASVPGASWPTSTGGWSPCPTCWPSTRRGSRRTGRPSCSP